jgi:hypothetical protein
MLNFGEGEAQIVEFSPAFPYLPGTLLTREWKGQTILVEVLAEGFRYENQCYPSLSAIAMAVTGTRWNGLAFFGLIRPAGRRRKEQQNAKDQYPLYRGDPAQRAGVCGRTCGDPSAGTVGAGAEFDYAAFVVCAGPIAK